MNGIEIIAAERQRQIDEEGFDSSNDLLAKPGSLTMAAICYALIAANDPTMRDELRRATPFTGHWPWRAEWWKPGQGNTTEDRILELRKAGALIAAEIDRLKAVDMQRPDGVNVQ
jgi:hypothetical protein